MINDQMGNINSNTALGSTYRGYGGKAKVKDESNPVDSFVATRQGTSMAERFYETAKYAGPGGEKKVFDLGFESIMESGGTSPDEKALAKFGKELGEHPGVFLQGKYAGLAEGIVMQTLSGAFFGPIGHRLANVFMRAVDATGNDDKKSSILSTGFKALQSNPLGTGEEKELAEKGSRAMHPSVNPDKALKDGRMIMTEIKKDAEFFGWAD
jgi:hypothetical protein